LFYSCIINLKMKKMKKILTLFLATTAGITAVKSQTTTLNFTGTMQTYTVPAGATSIFVQAWGSQGGSGALGGASVSGGAGGLGGYAEGFMAVTPGQVLNVFVGGQGATPSGGFNGGGNGGSTNAGGGGGASDIRVGGTAEVDRVIVAGGGGGGGRGGCDEGSATTGGIGGFGAFASAGVGQNGFDSPTSGGVAGGGKGGNFSAVQGAGGPAGDGCSGFLGGVGATTTTGTGANGGAGQTCCCSTSGSIPGGGGGGGGLIGGGGGGGGSAGTTACAGNSKGAGAGGGGGSNYIGGVTSGVTNNGIWLGNGLISIVAIIPPVVAASTQGTAILCNGDSTTVTVTATLGDGTYTGTGTYTVAAGTYTYIVTDGTGDTAATTIVVTQPNAIASTTAITNNLCFAGTNGAIDLSVTGGTSGFSYIWSNGATSQDLSGLVAGTYSYTITDVNGCVSNGTATLTDPAALVVALSIATDSVCQSATSFALTGGTPAGGVYSGAGVSVGAFNPSVAGVGSNIITYTYTDVNGCSGTSTDVIVVNACTGIATYSESGTISVYPNPTSGMLNVLTTNTDNTLSLYDVLGNQVYTIEATSTSTQIDMKNFSNGIYFLKIENSKSVNTIRVIRNK
jgi:Secretion system C-terminal sorting domain